jgi:hypothetical protein
MIGEIRKSFSLGQRFVDLPVVKRRLLIRMSVTEGAYHRLYRIIGADHFHAKLIDSLESARLAEKGLTARHGLELSHSPNLPGAAAVVADSTSAGVEDRLFDFFDMRLRDVKAERIQWGSPEPGTQRGASWSLSRRSKSHQRLRHHRQRAG